MAGSRLMNPSSPRRSQAPRADRLLRVCTDRPHLGPSALSKVPRTAHAGQSGRSRGGTVEMDANGDWGQSGFEALGEEDCFALLGRGTIGRVGVTMGSIPVVLPVNYHFADGAIHFRTGEGTKLKAASQNTVVAFQVDEIDPTYHAGWSVLAVGVARLVEEHHALTWVSRMPLRAWAPGEREHFVRIVPEFISGRRILPGHDEPPPWP